MTCLITGGTGSVGTAVAALLAERGEAVVLYDLSPDRSALELMLKADALSHVDVVTGDILDREFLARTCQARGVDRIVHLAVAPNSVTTAHPHHAQRVNVEGTNTVFEVALAASVGRVVFASSFVVFGPKSADAQGVVGGDAPYDPRSVYAACKVLNEASARLYGSRYGLDVVGLRLPYVYGPVARTSAMRWIPDAIEALLRGRPAASPRGAMPGPMAYAEDIARAVLLALDAPKPPAPPVVTLDGDYRSEDDVALCIAGHFPGGHLAALPSIRPGLTPSLRYDTSAARELLGWRWRISLEDGISRIVDHHRSRLARGAPPTP